MVLHDRRLSDEYGLGLTAGGAKVLKYNRNGSGADAQIPDEDLHWGDCGGTEG